jgi:hypothetical protein
MLAKNQLTNLQLELIKTFARPIPEHQVIEIRKLLADYFAKKIDDDVDALFETNQWDASKPNEWLKEHLRTPYL